MHQTQPFFQAGKWCGQMLRAMQRLEKGRGPACPAFGLYLSGQQQRHYENEAGGGIALNAGVRPSPPLFILHWAVRVCVHRDIVWYPLTLPPRCLC
jgi:hypothetical protein